MERLLVLPLEKKVGSAGDDLGTVRPFVGFKMKALIWEIFQNICVGIVVLAVVVATIGKWFWIILAAGIVYIIWRMIS